MSIENNDIALIGIVNEYQHLERANYNVFYSDDLIRAYGESNIAGRALKNSLFVVLSGELEGKFWPILSFVLQEGKLTVKRTPRPMLETAPNGAIRPFYFAVIANHNTITPEELLELQKMVDDTSFRGSSTPESSDVSEDTGHSLQGAGEVSELDSPAKPEPVRPAAAAHQLRNGQVWAVFVSKRNPDTGESELVAEVARKITSITDAGVTYQQLGKYRGFVPKEASGTGKDEDRLLEHQPTTIGYANFLQWIKKAKAELVTRRELVMQLEEF